MNCGSGRRFVMCKVVRKFDKFETISMVIMLTVALAELAYAALARSPEYQTQKYLCHLQETPKYKIVLTHHDPSSFQVLRFKDSELRSI